MTHDIKKSEVSKEKFTVLDGGKINQSTRYIARSHQRTKIG